MIAPKQTKILRAINKYSYLSRLQLARLGIEKYNSAFTKHCQPLIEAKYIGVIDASNYGLGHIYYLTKRGAKFIAFEDNIELSETKFCINKPLLTSQTLYHRSGAINCQIELDIAIQKKEIGLVFYDRDIERLGNIRRDNNLTRKTRVSIGNNEFLEPDAIFQLQLGNIKKLYCLEYEHRDNTQKSFAKILKHVKALNLKSPSKKYNHDKAHRTLFIYSNEATMNSIMTKTGSSIESIDDWFLFKTYDQVLCKGKFIKGVYTIEEPNDFLSGWLNSAGETKSIF